MAINIKFNLTGSPEPPTIILANRNGNKLGQLKVNEDSINLNDKFNDISEISFTINKYIDDRLTPLWGKVVDFKLIYCKEWDCWFEISVELDEETETVKTVFGTQLGQAELSQIMLYDVEINTEEDIERSDYILPTVLYRRNGELNDGITKEEADKLDKLGKTVPYKDYKSASLLHRLLNDKAPHYSIDYVSPTISKIQRSFSFDDDSIYDSLQEVAEEIGCLFIFNSGSDKNGKPERTISIYDLQQNCNDCGYRGEYTDKCPKCGSTNITNGYGDDTLIFVTSDELASDGIQLKTDTDAVKNCFKLEAGDDLMTATVRNCNPNGTDYIWYFSNDIKEDMPTELVEKLDSYNEIYKQYYNEYVLNIDGNLLNDYNSLVDKYSVYNKNLQKIDTPIKGYSSLMNAYYNTIDLVLYLESGLMPSVEMSETNAKEQITLLTTSSLSPVAVSNVTIASLSTIDSAVLAMAKTIIKSTYKIEIGTSEIIKNGDNKNWKGNFVITNYSDEEDTATSNAITIEVNDDLETFVKQKIEKELNKEEAEDYSISELFKKEYADFCTELRKYSLNYLSNFHESCQSCIDILIEQGVGNNSTWSDTEAGSEGNLYEKLYVPYYNKLVAIDAEMRTREDEINIISGVCDVDGNIVTKGLQTYIEDGRIQIQNALDFKKYLGEELWLEFCSYRREDKYSNDNYISDGLNNAELFKKALEFFEVAEKEIYKSSELQHSISTSLNNLLVIPKFKPLVESFKVGNWIRIQVDDRIYKLRLLEYEIDFGDFNNISVDFSDVTKVKNGITDVKSVLSQASSMATSYSSVQRQASQGEKSNTTLNSWVDNGLNATNTKIIGTENQNQVWDKNGILCREYDPITNTYSDEQLKIINSTIAITNDNWKSTKTAIGKYYYIDPVTNELKCTYGVNSETIVGKLFVGENLLISNDKGNLEFNNEGFVVTGDRNTVVINPNNSSVFAIKNSDNNYILHINDEGNLVVTGDIIATSLKMEDGSIVEGINVGDIAGMSPVAVSGSYNDLKDKPTKLSDFENDKLFITKDVNNLTNYYKKKETDDLLNSKVNSDSLATVATTGSYNDLKDKPMKLSDFENDELFVTDDTDTLKNYYKKSEVDNLLNSKVNADSISTVAATGSYNDLVDISELKNWVLEQIQSAIN